MPAEWDAHLGTWLSWPHNQETWPDELAAVEHAMAQVVRALAPGETVFINVNDAAHERHVRTLLDSIGVTGSVRFLHIPTNDAWVRDHGAIFVTREVNGQRELAATDWGFNSWGGKYPPFDLDNTVPRGMAMSLDVPRFEADIILEGGSIDVNGEGILLTTEACLLNPNRNPHLGKGEIEDRLRRFLGVREILWLGDGIVGDDTDGHVDDITRFVGARKVLSVVEADRDDPNFEPLQENLERLHRMNLEVVELPLPAPVYLKGERMPASYANFYVGNRAVVVPVYGDPRDEDALRTIGSVFPGREIAPVYCRELIWGLGAIHCMTQQVPA